MCKQSLILCGEKKIILVTKKYYCLSMKKNIFGRSLTQCCIAYLYGFNWISLDFIVHLLAIFCGMKKCDAIIF